MVKRKASGAALLIQNVADFTRVDVDSASPQSDSALMQKLPPEIRTRIYELVLDDVVVVNIGNHARHDHKKGLPAAPALLMTCKHIYSEAIKLYWSDTTFQFPGINGYKFGVWLTKIQRRRRELLSNVQLENRSWRGHPGRRSRPLDMADLRNMAETGHRQLRECQAGKRGVAEGVLEISLMVPISGSLKVAPDALMRIWTSTPKATAAMYM